MDIDERDGRSYAEGNDSRRDDMGGRRDGDSSYGAGREAGSDHRAGRPRFNRDSDGDRQRSFRPRFSGNSDGERRSFRPRYNDEGNGGERRSFRPRYNDEDNGGERRSFRPRYNEDGNGGERRSFRPRYNDEGNGGERRSFRPRYNDEDNGGERRSFRPRYNDEGNGGERRSFRPRYNDEGNGGERRSFRPRYNDEGNGGERRSFRPRYNDEDNGGERRSFRPRYNDEGNGGERRSFRPRYNDEGNGGERRGFRSRYNDGDRRRDGDNRRFNDRGNGYGHHNDRRPEKSFHMDESLFDKEDEFTQNGTDPERQSMPEKLRLNRYIALSGVCSRRDADELIKNGKIKVNGVVVTEMGIQVTKDDKVEYDGKVLKAEKKVYVLLNKPKDCVTTAEDPEGRRTVMDIVANACEERIYPVGRLDRNTTGLLLLTNDGDMAEKLMHPRYEVRKIYHVFLDKNISEADIEQIRNGLELEDGPITVDEISYVDNGDKSQVGVVIHSGRNRIVRRIFESLNYNVEKLDRVYYGGLTKLNVPRGHWRYLTDDEINRLKAGFVK